MSILDAARPVSEGSVVGRLAPRTRVVLAVVFALTVVLLDSLIARWAGPGTGFAGDIAVAVLVGGILTLLVVDG